MKASINEIELSLWNEYSDYGTACSEIHPSDYFKLRNRLFCFWEVFHK